MTLPNTDAKLGFDYPLTSAEQNFIANDQNAGLTDNVLRQLAADTANAFAKALANDLALFALIGGIAQAIANHGPGGGSLRFWTGSQAQYNALSPASNTIYIVTS